MACKQRIFVLAVAAIGCGGSGSSGDANDGQDEGITNNTSVTEATTESGSAGTSGSATTATTNSSASEGSIDTSGAGTDTTTSGAATEGTTTGSATAATESSGSTAGTTGDIVPCDIAEAMLEPVPPNVMLVLDKSGSMITNTWDHDDNPGTAEVTRWYSLYQVVDFVVTTFDAQINFGANLFPAENATATYNANACTMNNAPEIPVAPNNANAILAGIPAANAIDIYGGTPATIGVTVAHDHLLSLGGTNPTAMVLITDGAANCSADAMSNFELFEVYDDQLPVVVGDAWDNDQIPTYVVGIDILDAVSPIVNDGSPDSTNTYDALSTVAQAGGKPNNGPDFYQTTNEMELQDALQQIIDDALSCTVPLEPAPAFPDLLQVYIDNMQVPQVMDCASEDGWVYTNPNGPYDSIELCGAWCDTLKMVGSVTAEYFCNPG